MIRYHSLISVCICFCSLLTPLFGEVRQGGTIVVASSGEPSNLITMLASDSASHDISGLIFNGLVKYGKDLTVIGDLAENWDISPDGLIITFHLRHNVKWHDGVEFTADDVMFGYQTIIDEKVPSAYKEDYLQVQSAEVPDKYTFRVTYKKPFAPALSSWGSLVVLPKHLLLGKDLTKCAFARRPVGTGPFKFEKWVSGTKIVLRANDDYFDGRPCIDTYVSKIIPDEATSFLELKAGNIDWLGITPFQYSRQTDGVDFSRKFNKYRYPTFAYTYLGFNLKHRWFKDKRVRQAFAYAIDKQELVDGVLMGLGEIATGPYVPHTWPYNPNVKKYGYNPAQAKKLLADAGWRDSDGDGWLDKDGERFEFTLLTNMGNKSRVKAATIVQWRLRKIGVKMKIRVLEWSTFINEFIDKHRFEAVMLGWSIGLDPDQYDIWHSSKTGEKELNFIEFKNSEVDNLLEQGRRNFDIDKRKESYFRIQEILADELPYIFLYVPDALQVLRGKIKGVAPAPIGISYNLKDWYIDAN